MLHKQKHARYFENIPQIISKLTQNQGPRFSSEQRENLISIFSMIQKPFDKHRGKRCNFLSYSYTIYKICELMGYKEFTPYLQLLKAPQNLIKADAIWEKICKECGFEFIKTR